MNDTPKCRTCSVELDKGFIPDYSHGAAFQSKWVEGDAEKADRMMFMKMPGIKIPKLDEGIKVDAYRCPQCGLLEFYAKD